MIMYTINYKQFVGHNSTALHQALMAGYALIFLYSQNFMIIRNVELVKMLVLHGADRNIKYSRDSM